MPKIFYIAAPTPGVVGFKIPVPTDVTEEKVCDSHPARLGAG